MVRKGSPVRVRQRALKTALRRGFLVFGSALVTPYGRKGSTVAIGGRCAVGLRLAERRLLSAQGTDAVHGRFEALSRHAPLARGGPRQASNVSPTTRRAAPRVIVGEGCCRHVGDPPAPTAAVTRAQALATTRMEQPAWAFPRERPVVLLVISKPTDVAVRLVEAPAFVAMQQARSLLGLAVGYGSTPAGLCVSTAVRAPPACIPRCR
jgi:hypothetical protein